MAKNKGVAAILLFIFLLLGLVANSRNIRSQLSYEHIPGQSFVEPRLSELSSSDHYDNEFVPSPSSDCLSARKHTFHAPLPKPYINLGFPKMGTSTLHHYFGECGGLVSTHLKCGRTQSCVQCTKRSVADGLPPLATCQDADVYAQLDDGVYFPQIELLEELVRGHPNSTFFLTFRSMKKWYHSISHWPPRKNGPHMDDRWKKENITGSPPPREISKSNPEEFSDWYCRHVKRVRRTVARSPLSKLVEVDIEDPDAGRRMEDMFGIDESCWGHTNVNTYIHPEANWSEVVASKFIGQFGGGDNDDNAANDDDNNEDGGNNEDVMDDGDEQTHIATENESRNSDLGRGATASRARPRRRHGTYPKSEAAGGEPTKEDASDHDTKTPDCLKARKDSVPASLYGKLPKPYINLGFPKTGTSSLHHYFGKCGGLVSTHLKCGRNQSCVQCAKRSVAAGLPPLANCGKADVYAQLDNGSYFPQIELLEELVRGHSNATFFLTFRSMEKWYHSLQHWPPRKNGPHMDERFKRHNITGSPPSEGKSNQREFADWFCRHVTRVRKVVGRNPFGTLVEVDIEDPDIGRRMEDMFGIDEGCWGHTNVNSLIHPEANQTEVMVSRIIAREKRKRDARRMEDAENNGDDDKDDANEDDSDEAKDNDEDGMDDGDGDEQTHSATENESHNSFDPRSEAAGEEPIKEEESNTRNHHIKTPDCLKARKDSVPVSFYRNLPKPYINLGFPKTGTTSLHHYFKCGGLDSTHLKCGKGSKKCAVCMRESVDRSLPPLSECGKADVYAQVDDGSYFPQIELLEELVHGHSNATFFLTFRSMERWYHSLTHWPPRKNGPHMDERFKKRNITGGPSSEGKSNQKEFTDWFCRHVTRVRKIVGQNPLSKLVEVDIEDPDIGLHMEDMFGIDKSCWGHTNVNSFIHPEVNQTEVMVSRFIVMNEKKRGTRRKDDAENNGEHEDEMNDHEEGYTYSAVENEPKSTLDSEAAAAEENAEEDDKSHDAEDHRPQSPGDAMTPDCLKARNDTVPESLFLKLPKPYINLGFPKMGTTSLYRFFQCGGLASSHYYCPGDVTCFQPGRNQQGCLESCAKCTKESVESGLSPLSLCGKFDVYSQLDNGFYFPQIELLEDLVRGHSDATFFLTFRNMERWYHSLSNWPKKNPSRKLDERIKMHNITGSPSSKTESNVGEFSDWYCKHVQRVRNLFAKTPTLKLVEIDIEDPGTGQRLEDMFGIGNSCWGDKNSNTNKAPPSNELPKGKEARKTKGNTGKKQQTKRKRHQRTAAEQLQ